MRFEKISYEQWIKTCEEVFGKIPPDSDFKNMVNDAYNNIKLPRRSTEYSAGYDFFNPFPDITVYPNKPYKYITGIRWVGEDTKGKVLLIVPRSGLGCKFGLSLRNTIGVIDSDYQYAANEGHIMAVLKTDTTCVLERNKSIMQGIITNYFVTDDDAETEHGQRSGGFGSTG